jgi:hypothetical protein
VSIQLGLAGNPPSLESFMGFAVDVGNRFAAPETAIARRFPVTPLWRLSISQNISQCG